MLHHLLYYWNYQVSINLSLLLTFKNLIICHVPMFVVYISLFPSYTFLSWGRKSHTSHTLFPFFSIAKYIVPSGNCNGTSKWASKRKDGRRNWYGVLFQPPEASFPLQPALNLRDDFVHGPSKYPTYGDFLKSCLSSGSNLKEAMSCVSAIPMPNQGLVCGNNESIERLISHEPTTEHCRASWCSGPQFAMGDSPASEISEHFISYLWRLGSQN